MLAGNKVNGYCVLDFVSPDFSKLTSPRAMYYHRENGKRHNGEEASGLFITAGPVQEKSPFSVERNRHEKSRPFFWPRQSP